MALAAVFSLPLRANVPTAVATTLINNPVTFLPIMATAYQIGNWVLELDHAVPGEPIATNVRANAGWVRHLRASTATWSATTTSPGAPARPNKPAGDLKWALASNGTFAALTNSDVNLFSGPATASSATTLFFRTAYDWTLDTPGNYSLSIVLTLTSP
jgi:hypothetical protein